MSTPVARVADAQRLDRGDVALGELVEHVAVDEHALGAVQTWPALVWRAVDDRRDGEVEVGVAPDDRRRLAAELERDAREVRRPREAMIALPVSRWPVKETSDVSGEATSARAGLARRRVTRLRTPGGRSSCSSISRTSASVESGETSLGLTTTVLPVSSAGASLRHSTASGKFHGQIARDDADGRAQQVDDLAAARRRAGSRPRGAGPTRRCSAGSPRRSRPRPSASARRLADLAARSAPRARRGARRRRRRCARISAPRAGAGSAPPSRGCARRAAASAASTSSAEALATVASTRSVVGSRTSIARPSPPSQAPST